MADYPDPTLPGPANGVVRGDVKAMPDKGTGTGFVGSDSYGASVDVRATNSRPIAGSETTSDPMDMRFPKGDEDRFTSTGGKHGSDPGAGVGNAGDSDPPEEDRSDPQQIPMPAGAKEDE